MDDSVISPGNKIDNPASKSYSSSLDGGATLIYGKGYVALLPTATVSRDQLRTRIKSLQQQNRVLKVKLDIYKLRVKALQEENPALRQASVSIQPKVKASQKRLKQGKMQAKIQLKKKKETLAHHYEREEECLTKDLSTKLIQLFKEKCRLEKTLEQEQEFLANNRRTIEKLEAETVAKQTNLEKLRREKVELENTLEQEQEALLNRLRKRNDKLKAEKRSLQIRLDQPVSDPASPRDNGRQTLVRSQEQQRPVQRVPPMNSQRGNKVPPSGRPSEQSLEPQSAKMLIFLQNGEQRLITFTLPKESCTLQEVLEQVNVPFSEDTHIQCMQNTTSEIDYFVSVGSTSPIEDLLENHPMLAGDVSSGSSSNVSLQPQSTCLENSASHSPESPAHTPPPRYVDGMLALCKSCGYTGFDFSRCERCKRVFTEEPKSVLITSKKVERKKALEKFILEKHNTFSTTDGIKLNLLKTKVKNLNSKTPVQEKKPLRVRKPRGKQPEPDLTLSSDEETSNSSLNQISLARCRPRRPGSSVPVNSRHAPVGVQRGRSKSGNLPVARRRALRPRPRPRPARRAS